MQRGILIAIEGVDGPAKAGQVSLLLDHLVADRRSAAGVDFPSYAQPSSYFIMQYQDGAYGDPAKTSPYTASLFYALDHYETGPDILRALEAGKTVVVQGFSASNMAQQGAKFGVPEELSAYFIWLDNLEFELLQLPRPDLNIVLRTTAVNQQSREAMMYERLALLYPRDFQVIDCQRAGRPLDPEAIHQLVWSKVEGLLPVQESAVLDKPAGTAAGGRAARLSVLAETNLRYQPPGTAKLPQAIAPIHDPFWFYAPKVLKAGLRKQYASTMGRLKETYEVCFTRLSDYLAKHAPAGDLDVETRARSITQNLLPLATFVEVSAEADLPLDEDALMTVSGVQAKLQDIANESLPRNYTGRGESVRLTRFSPRNELDLVPLILYRFSDQPLEQISDEVDGWPYDKKAAILRTYAMSERQKSQPDPVLDAVGYEWDLVTSYAMFRDFAASSRTTEAQLLSPRLGYDVPKEIEAAGLADLFESSFDLSLELHSQLQAAGFTAESQYACLIGHRLRWSATTGYTELGWLKSVLADDPQLMELLPLAHPLLAELLAT